MGYNSSMFEIEHYLTSKGQDLIGDWLSGLRDVEAKARIAMRINRMKTGNPGDCKPVGEGVWEMRVDCGPGYRVYYAQAGQKLILLLLGGDKRQQARDINQAHKLWQDYQERTQTK